MLDTQTQKFLLLLELFWVVWKLLTWINKTLMHVKQRYRRRRALLQHQNFDFLFYLGWSGCFTQSKHNIMKVVQSWTIDFQKCNNLAGVDLNLLKVLGHTWDPVHSGCLDHKKVLSTIDLIFFSQMKLFSFCAKIAPKRHKLQKSSKLKKKCQKTLVFFDFFKSSSFWGQY